MSKKMFALLVVLVVVLSALLGCSNSTANARDVSFVDSQGNTRTVTVTMYEFDCSKIENINDPDGIIPACIPGQHFYHVQEKH